MNKNQIQRKTIDTLLDCIEDDIELMGDNHIIYLKEENGEVLDYDYLPSDDYGEAVMLKHLKDDLLLKKQLERSARKLQIGMVQMKVVFSKPEENLEHAATLVKEAKDAGAQICVLPECLDLGWGNPDAALLAMPIPGKASDALCQMARENEVFLVAGLTEREGKVLFNTALLISDDGVILYKHRKINILTGVEDMYSIGDRLGVTKTKYGSIAIDICADNSENSLSIGITLGRMGADMLLSPCAWAVPQNYNAEKNPYGEEWHKPYRRLASTFAIPVVGVSNVGSVEKGAWAGWKVIGNSMAYDCDGSNITVLPYGEVAECVRVIEVHITNKSVTGTALAEKIAVVKK